MASYDGSKLVFGVVEPLPLQGFPSGKTRLRLRHNQFAVVNVRPPEGGIRRFTIDSRDGAWRPGPELAANRFPSFVPSPKTKSVWRCLSCGHTWIGTGNEERCPNCKLTFPDQEPQKVERGQHGKRRASSKV